MKLTTEEGGDLELIPEYDKVNVMLSKVELNEFTWEDENVQKLRWHFTVTDDGPWKGKDVTGDTSLTFKAHPNCKAYNWAVAIAGREYAPGDPFDTDEILGMRATVVIGHKPQKKTGRVFMRVNEVLAPRASAINSAPVRNYDPAVDGAKF